MTLISKGLPKQNLVLAAFICIGFPAVLFFAAARIVGNGASAAIAAAVFALAGAFIASALSRRVFFDPVTERIVVIWRNPVFRSRRAEVATGQFSAVESYYDSRNTFNVCLMERTGDKGLLLATFVGSYKFKSFWDIARALVETPLAREFRLSVSSTLGIKDCRFIGVHAFIKEPCELNGRSTW